MTRIGPTAAAATLSREAKPPKNPTPCKPCAAKVGLSPDAANGIRDRAAMCLWCNRHKPTDDRICPQDGANRLTHITRNQCPLGYFPDADGNVRWRRITWLGVPQPVRDHSWKVKGKGRGLTRKAWRESFPGCGCIKPLKAAWMWLSALFTR
jgi:hypothetical protein